MSEGKRRKLPVITPEATEAQRDGEISSAASRRDFLKLAGFGAVGAVMAGCSRGRAADAIPYLVQPEEVTPGAATWYASTCGACPAACGILIKNRDGRPVKIEGHPDHPLSRGGLCAAGQASVLSLYDATRLRGPVLKGAEAQWDAVDAEVARGLAAAKAAGKETVVLTGTTHGPSALALIRRLVAQQGAGRHVQWDPWSQSALADACSAAAGPRRVPAYDFSAATLVVSIDADFLGTWFSPVEHAKALAAARRLTESAHMARHIQVESRMSLTGSNADERIVAAPSDLPRIAADLARRCAQRLGAAHAIDASAPATVDAARLDALADELVAAQGHGLVVCGVNDSGAQRAVAFLNRILGHEGRTVDTAGGSFQALGSDAEFAALLADMEAGKVGALLIHGVNPVHAHPAGARFAAALSRVPLTVSFAEREDETAAACIAVCPDHHPLEAWADHAPRPGILSMAQPAVDPFGGTRAWRDSLAQWTGEAERGRHLVRKYASGPDGPVPGDAEWSRLVQAGFGFLTGAGTALDGTMAAATAPVLSAAGAAVTAPPEATIVAAGGSPAELEAVLCPTVGLADGRHAHNPWLLEMPDPVTKICWGNAASFAPATAARLSIQDGDRVEVKVGEASVTLPAHVQPGQHENAVVLTLGFGRAGTGRFSSIGPHWLEGRPTVDPAGVVGANAAPCIGGAAPFRYSGSAADVRRAPGREPLATTQLHHALETPGFFGAVKGDPREIVQQTTFAAWRVNPEAGHHEVHGGDHTLWKDDHLYPGNRWGMVLDLSACTGCSACVVGCQAENNVPVVGKDEVERGREMHWLRIDRYYVDGPGGSTDVVHQPMMCVHCTNAPCETVCPVLATVHSGEGLNQMVYNRCVGTRYCANNCPYKVRRFNWFDYPHESNLENGVLNPDVTVRSRGVMEKCSLCAQRIQVAKAEALREGRPLRDGEFRTACEQSCPADAIVSGNLNDPESRVAKLRRDPRHFTVLTELGTRPAVGYLTLVRNREEGAGEGGGHHG